MTLNSYREINLELTLKNQELKASLADRMHEIHQQNMELTQYREENRRLHQIIAEMTRKEVENEKFRRMVLDVIHKTSADFNSLVVALSTAQYPLKPLNNTTNNQPLNNITNHVQRRSSIRQQNGNDQPDGKGASITLPIPVSRANDLDLRSQTITADKVNLRSPRKQSYASVALRQHSVETYTDDNELSNENSVENELGQDYSKIEKSLIKQQCLTIINESEEGDSYRETCSQINTSHKRHLIEKCLRKSSSPIVATNFITISRGGYDERRKKEPKSPLTYKCSLPPYDDSTQPSTQTSHTTNIHTPRRSKRFSHTIPNDSIDSSNNSKSKISSDNEESAIDFALLPIVPSSTPFRIKCESNSRTPTIDTNLSNDSIQNRSRKSRKIKYKKIKRELSPQKPLENKRPKRAAAPKNLSEPKLTKKLRRP